MCVTRVSLHLSDNSNIRDRGQRDLWELIELVHQGRSLDDTRFQTVPFCYILYVEQWGFRCSMTSDHHEGGPRSSMSWEVHVCCVVFDNPSTCSTHVDGQGTDVPYMLYVCYMLIMLYVCYMSSSRTLCVNAMWIENVVEVACAYMLFRCSVRLQGLCYLTAVA